MKKLIFTLVIGMVMISTARSQDQKGTHKPTAIKDMVVFYSQNHFQGQRVKFAPGKIDPNKLSFHIRSAKVPSGKVLKLEGPHANSGQIICRQYTEDIHELAISFGQDATFEKIAYCQNELKACRCGTQ